MEYFKAIFKHSFMLGHDQPDVLMRRVEGERAVWKDDLRDAMADLPQRRSIRLKGYDYTRVGAYYLTICTDNRHHWFGRVAHGVMHPSPIGDLAQRCWDDIPQHMSHVEVGDFVVMPNHVHGNIANTDSAAWGVGH
jgi:hypothetical protein